MALFQTLLEQELRSPGAPARALGRGECRSSSGQPCGLCLAMRFSYEHEAAAKDRAAAAFWHAVGGGAPIEPLVHSPRGREYRTVTKRKAFRHRSGISLGFIGPVEHPAPGGLNVIRCVIEPESHRAIYSTVEGALGRPSAAPLRDTLLYLVVKGNYREQTVLFNVRRITPAVVHAANALSKALSARIGEMLVGCFLFEGDPAARYYLLPRERRPNIRKLFGQNDLFLCVSGRKFLYPPLAFSQVNESMLERFVEGAADLLHPQQEEALYDLYCGYGLFALCLASHVHSVTGIEIAHQAVAAATTNARRQAARNARFLQAAITPGSVGQFMRNFPPGGLLLLDPPRGGTEPGVLAALAAGKPGRVLHIFCNLEILPEEVRRWNAAGYGARRVVPFDMFPGVPELEMMVLLEPRR
jgi:tRNA/tmRNA/rRNA uracil-C5-methylase (TrmA/RlmC/RlmD family)